jgi:muconate cycloisomerase
MKCALEDPMVERVQAIASVAPEMKITIDPNCRFYRPSATLELARQLESYNIEVFEDPTPKDDLEWYVFMRREMKIPLALHLSSPASVIAAIQKDCTDCFNLGGGMVQFVKMAYIAEAAGKPIWHGSGVDLGILDMAYVHACAAAKACTMASDIIGNFLREDDLIIEPIRFEDGCAMVPQKPGLGVELDEEAVQKYRVDKR